MKQRWATPDALWLGAVALLASFHFWFPPLGEGLSHDTYSATGDGKKAFFLLVGQTARARGVPVRRNTVPLARALGDSGSAGSISRRGLVCVLGPERYPTASEWDALLDHVRGGGSLVVASREEKPAFEIPGTGVSVAEESVSGAVETKLPFRPGSEGFFWNSSGIVKGGSGALVTAGGKSQAVVVRQSSGSIVVVASDSVFSNEAFFFDDQSMAVLAFRLLEAGVRPDEIVFDESLNESGVPKVVGLLIHPPLRPVTVQILIALVCFAWWQSRRFGPRIPEAVASRQNIVDHTNAAGQLFFRSKDGSAPLRSYLRQLILELKLKTFRKQEERVLEPVALRLNESVESVKSTLSQVRRGARTPLLDRRDAATLIRRLALIRKAAKQRPGKKA